MINIKVYYKDSRVVKVQTKGHANYDESGKDIVCAAVSTLLESTIINVVSLNNEALMHDTKEGFQLVEILNEDKITDKLINNMIEILEGFEDDYPEYIKIDKKED